MFVRPPCFLALPSGSHPPILFDSFVPLIALPSHQIPLKGLLLMSQKICANWSVFSRPPSAFSRFACTVPFFISAMLYVGQRASWSYQTPSR
eukprot:2483600-Pyramimonas_sp.AAC.1